MNFIRRRLHKATELLEHFTFTFLSAFKSKNVCNYLENVSSDTEIIRCQKRKKTAQEQFEIAYNGEGVGDCAEKKREGMKF